MRLKIGNKLTEFLGRSNHAFARQLLLLEVPEGAKLNYIEAVVEDGKLKFSYLQDSRISVSPFDSPLRQTAKPVTVLKKLLVNVDLPALNSWIDKLKLHFAAPAHTIERVTGSDILFMYHEENHISGAEGSTLGQSCMRYNKCQPYIKFYARNEAVSGVWVNVDGKVAARALIWNATLNRKKVSVLDRIYAKDAVLEDIIHGWSMQNCDLTINHQTKLFRDNANGKLSYLSLYVPLNYKEPPFPYLDNFKFLQGSRLYNIYQPKTILQTLQNTDGGAGIHHPVGGYIPNHVWLRDHSTWLKPEEATLIMDRYVPNNEVVPCKFCDVPLQKRNTIVSLLGNERIYTCGGHYYPLEINGVLHNNCVAHHNIYPVGSECSSCATMPKTCFHCLRSSREPHREIAGRYLCSRCDGTTTCVTCRRTIRVIDTMLGRNGNIYCMACSQVWPACDDCGSTVEPGFSCYCEGDYNNCESCNTRLHIDDLYTLSTDEAWCRACIDEHAFSCYICDFYVPRTQQSEQSTNTCQSCWEEESFTCTNCNTETCEQSAYSGVCITCATNEYACTRCGAWTIAHSNIEGVCVRCNV